MKIINWLLLILFYFIAGLNSQAEANDVWRGGSVYSYFGLGLPHDYRATHADGMGIYGVAVHDNLLPSTANPAMWSRAIFTNISGAFELKSFEATVDENIITTRQFLSGPFQAVFPIKRDRLGLSLSLTPLTALRYSTENLYTLPPDQNHSEGELGYLVENNGSGGINRIEMGIGYRLTNSISLGYAPSLLLGVTEKKQTLHFDNDDYRTVNLTEVTSHYGFGNRIGIFISKRDLFRANDRTAFGATFSLPVNFVSEKTLKTKVDFRDVMINPPSYYGDGQVKFPLESSAGFSYNFNPYFQVSMDVLYQNWSGYTNFDGNSETFLTDRVRMGLGSQYLAARRDNPSFFSRFIYRIGVSYDSGNLKLSDTDIETVVFHAGLGIPSSNTNSSIDINAEYGFRGTEASGLVSEKIFALKISFNLSELMFIQRRLD